MISQIPGQWQQSQPEQCTKHSIHLLEKRREKCDYAMQVHYVPQKLFTVMNYNSCMQRNNGKATRQAWKM